MRKSHILRTKKNVRIVIEVGILLELELAVANLITNAWCRSQKILILLYFLLLYLRLTNAIYILLNRLFICSLSSAIRFVYR